MHMLISGLLGQLYDARGFFLSPIVIGIKIFLKRSCKLAGPTELDLDLRTHDKEFAVHFPDFLLHVGRAYITSNYFWSTDLI